MRYFLTKLSELLCGILLLGCSQIADIETVDSSLLDWPMRRPERVLQDFSYDSATSVLVDKDVVCVLTMPNKKGTPLLYMYDIEDGSCLRTSIPYGAGEGEMLLPFITKNHGNLLIYDAVKKEVAIIDIQDYAYHENHSLKTFATNIFSQEIIPVKDRLLFLNPYSFQGNAPRVRYSNRKWYYRETKSYHFDAANVVDGTLQFNPALEQIVYLADYEPIIEFMDMRGRLKKKIVFPHSVCEFEKVVHPELNIVEYLYPYREDPSFPDYSFVAADSNEKHIATVFWREDWQFVVMILDWNGNIQDGFCTGARVKNISIDRNSKSVYCWEEHEGRNVLLQYDIL